MLLKLAAAVAGLIGLRLGARRPRVRMVPPRAPRSIEPWMEEFHRDGR